MSRTYTPAQIAALLDAAQARYATATWDDAGLWLNAVRTLRDRLAMVSQ